MPTVRAAATATNALRAPSKRGLRSARSLVVVGVCLVAGSCGRSSSTTSAQPPLERETVPTSTTAPPSAPTSSVATTSTTSVPAHFDISTTTLRLVDHSRPTVSRGQALSPQRSLTTLVWYPTSAGRWPLVVFAHGFEVGPAPYEQLCRAWAAAGYVVAAPEFPLTDADVAGPAMDENDVVNQPDDVAFVVASLLTPTSPLAGHLDRTRVAVAGHSDGAVTALAVAAAHRVALRGVIAMSGAPVAGTAPNPPLLVAQGDQDTIDPPATGMAVYEQADRPRFMLSLLGGGHLPPFAGGSRWQAVVDKVTVDFLDRYVSARTSADTALRDDGQPGLASIDADP